MRLALVISSLGRGGAERTASVLASAWAAQGHEITIITLLAGDTPAYPLHPAVRLSKLEVYRGTAKNIWHGTFRHLRSIASLRHTLNATHPDVVLSFMDTSNILTLLAGWGLHQPVIITEHTHPAFHHIAWYWRMLRRMLYRRAAALVCMTNSVLAWMQEKVKVKCYVIPNPVPAVPIASQRSKKQDKAASYIVVAMGRLSREKGFDLLLEAFAQITCCHSNWQLRIVGDGPMREALGIQAEKLNLSGRIEFTGAIADPFLILRKADLFVMSSRYEGFGNALCEAMACGLPVISFDCPAGPREIIRNGIDGLLVAPENVNELAAAMDRLMSNAEERERMANRAPEVVARFGIQVVLNLWDRLFEGVIAQKRNGRE